MLATIVTALCAGCGATTDADGSLLVLGPASLADHLDEFNAPYTADGASFSFAGSTTQVRAVIEGLDADVLITANSQVAEPVVEQFGVSSSPLVTNRLAVVTPAGNPGQVHTLDDLARDDLLITVCAVEVPCGRATADLPVTIAADSREASVRAVLTKVQTGEADVGIVYESDVALGGESVEVPFALRTGQNVATTYVVLNLTETDAADHYVERLLDDGRHQLIDAGVGFGAP